MFLIFCFYELVRYDKKLVQLKSVKIPVYQLLISYDHRNCEGTEQLQYHNIFSADITAFAPSATAVTTWRRFLVRISPAAKIPGVLVTPSSPAMI